MTKKLNCLALGYTSAILCATIMLLFGIIGNMGIYMGAVQMMQQWHMSFSLSVAGIVAGMVEGALIGFVFGYFFGCIYNKFV